MPQHDSPSLDRACDGSTRRRFVGQVAVAAAAVAGGPLAQLIARPGGEKRVIVIGAGLAGLCSAYELSSLGHHVEVLEAQEHPGGRVHTLRTPFGDGLYAEAGASRIPESHDLTLGYARLFGLSLVPFEPAGIRSIRYAYRQRIPVVAGAAYECLLPFRSANGS